jgi:2,4-dienoyl-CoA reductase-like NADH-dependent reductase (Old Yellow Enzyme family)
MSLLFSPERIGTLEIPIRIVRSATAERLASTDGAPLPQLQDLYLNLVRGGVGLIITGHLYIHASGKAHPEMTGIYADGLISDHKELTRAVHKDGGRIVAQINHGGMQCSRETVSQTLAPSHFNAGFLEQPARAMTLGEIEETIDAFAQAARRAKEAEYDGVQLHGAHGYLINQFLSPYVNRRNDQWGGDARGRLHFLRRVCQAIREQVGADYPVFIKLGMLDGVEGGLSREEGVQIVAALSEMGLDAVEISGGVQALNSQANPKQPYFRPLAKAARSATSLPILLVGGIRSLQEMDDVLTSGDADFVSICRPLICDPDLPNRLRQGLHERARCISGNRCWPNKLGEGIRCRCLNRN